jgi:hypothetical protein
MDQETLEVANLELTILEVASLEVANLEEDIRHIEIDLNNLPDALIYKLPEDEFTHSASKFGMDWQDIEYYKNRIPAGLIDQFPCLYYLLVDYWKEATSRTPLEEIEFRNTINLDNIIVG